MATFLGQALGWYRADEGAGLIGAVVGAIGQGSVGDHRISWVQGVVPLAQERVECDIEVATTCVRVSLLTGIPQPDYHSSNQFMFCLQGPYEYTSTGVELTAGSFYCNPKGHVHGPAIAHEETIVVEIYDGPHYPEKPSWYVDERDAH